MDQEKLSVLAHLRHWDWRTIFIFTYILAAFLVVVIFGSMEMHIFYQGQRIVKLSKRQDKTSSQRTQSSSQLNTKLNQTKQTDVRERENLFARNWKKTLNRLATGRHVQQNSSRDKK